jgi:predicted enzyme related to lactoylglutathione lyase
MANQQTLRGLTTVVYYVDDVLAARQWYSELLGIEPYFQRPDTEKPAYIEFRIGDYQHEFGFIDRKFAPPGTNDGPGRVIVYWHVDDLDAMVAKVKAMGATEHEPITTRGEGLITASVVDPFGNVLGLMYNAHYLEILESRDTA